MSLGSAHGLRSAQYKQKTQGEARKEIVGGLSRLMSIEVRAAAFEWLSTQVESHGDVLPRTLLTDGFMLDDMRVPLLGPQGIFKPRALEEAPLSITTAPKGLYDDSLGVDGLLRYRYRGTGPWRASA